MERKTMSQEDIDVLKTFYDNFGDDIIEIKSKQGGGNKNTIYFINTPTIDIDKIKSKSPDSNAFSDLQLTLEKYTVNEDELISDAIQNIYDNYNPTFPGTEWIAGVMKDFNNGRVDKSGVLDIVIQQSKKSNKKFNSKGKV